MKEETPADCPCRDAVNFLRWCVREPQRTFVAYPVTYPLYQDLLAHDSRFLHTFVAHLLAHKTTWLYNKTCWLVTAFCYTPLHTKQNHLAGGMPVAHPMHTQTLSDFTGFRWRAACPGQLLRAAPLCAFLDPACRGTPFLEQLVLPFA